jgi:hypothetical protein
MQVVIWIAAYTLELRAKFPSKRSFASEEESSWRQHALTLERRLEEVQTRYKEDHISMLHLAILVLLVINRYGAELLALSEATRATTPLSSATESGLATKKKVKKKLVQQGALIDIGSSRTDLDAILNGLHDSKSQVLVF